MLPRRAFLYSTTAATIGGLSSAAAIAQARRPSSPSSGSAEISTAAPSPT